MGKSVVILGAQWGDEGKGKIVDLLTERVGAVARFQGGHNAGHTLIVNGKKIRHVKDTATKNGMPLILLGESSGARMPDPARAYSGVPADRSERRIRGWPPRSG